MPTVRNRYRDGLPPAVVFVLAHGELPPHDGSERVGLLKAFVLKHDWHRPEVLRELRLLWSGHADEILALTPEGATPWVLRLLSNPTPGDEDDPVDDNEED